MAYEITALFSPPPTSALIPASRLVLLNAVALPSSLLTGLLSTRTRRVRLPTVLAFLLLVAFFAAMATTTTSRRSDRAVWGYVVLPGVGLGAVAPTLVAVAQLSTPRELICTASGLFVTVRSLGGTVGLAVYNAVFSGAVGGVGEKVARVVVPMGLGVDEVGRFVRALMAGDAAALGGVPDVTREMVVEGGRVVREVLVVAFRRVWISAGCFVVLAAVGELGFRSCDVMMMLRLADTLRLQVRASWWSSRRSSTWRLTTRLSGGKTCMPPSEVLGRERKRVPQGRWLLTGPDFRQRVLL